MRHMPECPSGRSASIASSMFDWNSISAGGPRGSGRVFEVWKTHPESDIGCAETVQTVTGWQAAGATGVSVVGDWQQVRQSWHVSSLSTGVPLASTSTVLTAPSAQISMKRPDPSPPVMAIADGPYRVRHRISTNLEKYACNVTIRLLLAVAECTNFDLAQIECVFFGFRFQVLIPASDGSVLG